MPQIGTDMIFSILMLSNVHSNLLVSLHKRSLISRKSNFRISDILVSWRHQIPKHKTRNTFYWIIWEVNTACQWNLASLCHIARERSKYSLSMKFGQFMSYCKRNKIIKKFYKICDRKTSPRLFCVCKELGITSIEKGNFRSKLSISYM